MTVLLATTVLLTALADQLVKRAVLAADVPVTRNTRGALVALAPHVAVLAYVAVAVAVTAALTAADDPRTATIAGVGLVLGGAAGNLVDRLRRGAVLDFIVLGRWPAFNLADAAMTVGAVLTIGSLL